MTPAQLRKEVEEAEEQGASHVPMVFVRTRAPKGGSLKFARWRGEIAQEEELPGGKVRVVALFKVADMRELLDELGGGDV